MLPYGIIGLYNYFWASAALVVGVTVYWFLGRGEHTWPLTAATLPHQREASWCNGMWSGRRSVYNAIACARRITSPREVAMQGIDRPAWQ
ncbi:MAG: hypothetical protein U1U88_002353 [Lawsonella clevelandensis]